MVKAKTGEIPTFLSFEPKPGRVGIGRTGEEIHNTTKWPHGLIAGPTGTGKSTFVRQFILSEILKKAPRQLKLVLFDLKEVQS